MFQQSHFSSEEESTALALLTSLSHTGKREKATDLSSCGLYLSLLLRFLHNCVNPEHQPTTTFKKNKDTIQNQKSSYPQRGKHVERHVLMKPTHYTILYILPAAQMRSSKDSNMDYIQSHDHSEHAR